MDNRRREQKVHRLNLRWLSGVSLSVLCVVVAIVGIALVEAGTMSRGWAFGFLVLGLFGAATALLQTMMRNKAGDDIDEAKL